MSTGVWEAYQCSSREGGTLAGLVWLAILLSFLIIRPRASLRLDALVARLLHNERRARTRRSDGRAELPGPLNPKRTGLACSGGGNGERVHTPPPPVGASRLEAVQASNRPGPKKHDCVEFR